MADGTFDPTQFGAVAVDEPTPAPAFDPTAHGAIPVQEEAPQQPSGFEKGLETAQQALGYGQKTLGLLMNPVGALHKIAFPEEAKLVEEPLISAPTATSVVQTLQAPQRAILKAAFGDTGERLSKASGRFLGEQVSGFTSPESLALLAVAPAIGKLGGIKTPTTLRETAFGKTEPITPAEAASETAIAQDVAQPILPSTVEAGEKLGSQFQDLQTQAANLQARINSQRGETNASTIQEPTSPDGGLRTRIGVGELPQGNVESADARLRSDQGIQTPEARKGAEEGTQTPEADVAPDLPTGTGEAVVNPIYEKQVKRTGVIDLPNGDTIRVLESDAQSGKYDVVAIRDGKRSVVSDPANPVDISTAQKSAVDAASGRTLFTEQAPSVAAAPTEQVAAIEKPSLGEPHEKTTKGGGAFPGSTEMADRAGRVATLLRLNDRLPEGTGYDSNALGRVSNAQIDSVRDYLVNKYNETKTSPVSEAPVSTTAKTSHEIPTPETPAEPLKPPPTPAEVSAADRGETVGIAERYREDQQPGSVIPGIGRTADEARAWGHDFINKGGNPYDVVANKGPKRELWQDVGVVRAEYERLSNEKRAAESALESNPNDPQAQMAFENADLAQRKWSKDAQPVLTRAGDALRAASRSYPREINTFSDFTDIVNDHFKGEVELTPEKRAELQKAVKAIKKGNLEATEARTKVTDAVIKKAGGRVLPFDDLKTSLQNKMTKLMEDCVL